MKDNSDQDYKTHPGTDTGREFAARRSVVKGLASAVPVVMTIGCGKALANDSTIACMTTPPVSQPQVCIDPSEGANDRFLRRTKSVTIDIDSITGEEITADNPLSNYDLPTAARSSRAEQVTATRTRTRQPNSGTAAQYSRIQQQEVQKQCLVYVNERGEFVRDAFNGNPVTESCYASFMQT